MANVTYTIKQAENSITEPFTLTRGTNIETVTSVNGNNKYIWFRDNMEGCSALTTFVNVKLTNDNCASMFSGCSALTNVKIQYASAMTKGDSMFKFCAFTSATQNTVGNLSTVVEAYAMFSHCESLVSFSNDFSNLVNGGFLFNECYVLTSLTASFPKLQNGNSMFCRCRLLETFPTSYPELTSAEEMFKECNRLVDVNFIMPKLSHTKMMFLGCENLKTWTGNLSLVENNDDKTNTCKNMFYNCPALEEVNITTNSGNEALFTRQALGMLPASVVIKINGTPID